MQVLYMGNNSVKDWGEFMKLVSGGTCEGLGRVHETGVWWDL